MKKNLKSFLFRLSKHSAKLVLSVSLLSVVSAYSQGRYVTGDFHQHTTFTDGSYSYDYMMSKNNEYGLDWWANSEHGGSFNRDGRVSGIDLGTTIYWANEEGIEILGDETGNPQKMWRWQSLRDFVFAKALEARAAYPERLIIQGYEMNVPGHEHGSVSIITGQFDEDTPNDSALAEFEFKFDNSDRDQSGGVAQGWVKSTKSGHAKTIEAIEWMQTNHQLSSWLVPAHPERKKAYTIAHFRDMNNAGPDVCFGFESMPGHQKSSGRGGYGSSADGAGTYGGCGIYAAKIGGLWDAMLTEGRHWWLFANSDFHSEGGDYYPGEYQKNHTYVEAPDNALSIVEGLRSGNTWVAQGDLIDSLAFDVEGTQMGQTLITEEDQVTVNIIVRDPSTNNHNTYSDYKNPELDHIDLIAGKMLDELIDPSEGLYNVDTVATTKVIARFDAVSGATDANGITSTAWTDLGNGFVKITYTLNVNGSMYIRLRGTNLGLGVENQTDANGNPLADALLGANDATKPWEDVWFYSNPIFIEDANANKMPKVFLTSPSENESFLSLNNVVFGAKAKDLDGKITKVEFYVNDELAGTDTAAPYSLRWTAPEKGQYAVFAKAYDNLDSTAISQSLSFYTGKVQLESVGLIAGGMDDVEENTSDSSIYDDSSDLELAEDGSASQLIGMRFTGLNIPANAAISSAYIQFTVDETNSGACDLTLMGEKVSSSEPFETSKANVSLREKTTTTVSWQPADWNTVGEAGEDQRTPDITSIIEEIMSVEGFDGNGAITIMLTGTGERTAESFNGSSSQAPKLVITYTNPMAPVSTPGYYAGDFHQHSTFTDGSYSLAYMMDVNNNFGLDWWANSEHGGAFNRDGRVSGIDLENTSYWTDDENVTILGDATGNPQKMWRWQSLSEYTYPIIADARNASSDKTIFQGYEMNVPGHEHGSVCIIGDQFRSNGNVNALAEFEYKFDNSDGDQTGGAAKGWVKSTASGHEKTLEAIEWLQKNFTDGSWLVPAHPERKQKYTIADFRDMNTAGPDVCFGFESMSGHQKSGNRGGYSKNADGGGTYGGCGFYAAKVGGLWDAMLSEGRNWWLFVSSDFHSEGGDFYPGEFQKTHTYIENLYDPYAIVNGLRSGNSWIVEGDLINELSFEVTDGMQSATMGQTFELTGDSLTVKIVVRDPQTDNHNTYSSFTNPVLDHVDLIAGKVTGMVNPSDDNYNLPEVSTTAVIARFDANGGTTDANGITSMAWKDLGSGLKEISYTIKNVSEDMYFRLRGSNFGLNVPNETDESGNPLSDTLVPNSDSAAFADLWFYSNPIFVEVTEEEAPAIPEYIVGDFHQHTTYTDGSYSYPYMMSKNNAYGLDWWANSEHGGSSKYNAAISGIDKGEATYWDEMEGLEIKGDETISDNHQRMWRWQTLKEFTIEQAKVARAMYPEKMILQGYEMNVPGHEHGSVGIISGQFGENGNADALAQFEYMFDGGDADQTGGAALGWGKSTAEGHARTIEAIEWMQANHPATSWLVPAHPERKQRYTIADFRDMNNAGTDVCFGFESMPGHQKSSNRGGYKKSADGGGTYGGCGFYAAKVGGLWDAMLSEGRNWWLFASSDFHSEGGDFYPGEYEKTYTFVENKKDPKSIVTGLRSGNTWVVQGDLIDELEFTVENSVMGQVAVTDSNKVVITIKVHDPQEANHNTYSDYTNPSLDHIDVIAGKVSGMVDPSSAEYNVPEVSSTQVIARFSATNGITDNNGITSMAWNNTGDGYYEMSFETTISDSMYFRLRGSNIGLDVANQTDANGNPLSDTLIANTAEESFADLWFYSNPIFVVSNYNRVSIKDTYSISADMSVYPNPANDVVNVSFSEKDYTNIKVMSLVGELVYRTEGNDLNFEINLSEQLPGIYFIAVQRNGSEKVTKVIKR